MPWPTKTASASSSSSPFCVWLMPAKPSPQGTVRESPPFRARSAAALRAVGDERQREAVVALAADGLDRGGADARLGGQQLVEAAGTLDARVVAGRVEHRALAHHVVGDDQAAAAGQPQRPGEV